MSTEPKLRLEHVTKQFDIRGTDEVFTAVEDINIDVAPGEFLVLVGPSGCGKSTLLDLLGGLSSPTSGRILLDGKQITGAGLEDHFCGKLLGLPMGCDVCYTNHAEADQDDMDALLTLLGTAGVNYIMGVPGADDLMLNYQSTSFHDALYRRSTLGLRPAPEFEAWLSSDLPGRLSLPTQLQLPGKG